MLNYQVRPLENWIGERTKTRTRSQFSAPWSKTLDLLERELEFLRAREIVIQADVASADIKNDGMLRASAIPKTPAVKVSFQSKHGPLSYPCDKFLDWRDNVRAVALALEALRMVSRYGVVRNDEQYRGWQLLPASAVASNGFATAEDAAEFLLVAAEAEHRNPTRLLASQSEIDRVYRAAAVNHHPDHGGNVEVFKCVQTAKDLIEKQHSGKA